MSKRSIIYIDGFNLYYGAIKDTKWKWLNLERYFTLVRQDDDIQIIKYFTATFLHRGEGLLCLEILFPGLRSASPRLHC